jgi:hypothetical protein
MFDRDEVDQHRFVEPRRLTRDEVMALSEEEVEDRWNARVQSGRLTKKEMKKLSHDERVNRNNWSDIAFAESVIQGRLLLAATPLVLEYVGMSSAWCETLCLPGTYVASEGTVLYTQMVYPHPHRLIGYEKVLFETTQQFELHHLILDHAMDSMLEHLHKRTQMFQPGGKLAKNSTVEELAAGVNVRAQADGYNSLPSLSIACALSPCPSTLTLCTCLCVCV